MLASTWACVRFVEFLIRKTFHIETDHKPLIPLLGSKSLDELPPHVQHLCMRLMRFSYTISHVPGKAIATARYAFQQHGRMAAGGGINLYVDSVIASLPETEKRLEELPTHQDDDPVLYQVKQLCLDRWPDKHTIGNTFTLYLQFSDELTVQKGLLLYGSGIVIPASLRAEILSRLHEGYNQMQGEGCGVVARHQRRIDKKHREL